MKNRMKRAAASVLLLLLMTATSAFAADGKFRPNATTTSATSRYVVALSDMAADDPSTIANALAVSYGGRLEPYAAEGFRGFAIVMTPTRARLLSADPRVEWVEEHAASVLPPAIAAATNFTPTTDATAISWTTGAYSYDGAGNITSIGPGTGSVTQTYQYDAVGRLATGTANTTAQNNAQTYRYDRYGNLTEIVTTAGAAAPATAKLAVDPTSNQITKVSDCDPHGPPCYTATYDQAGNVLTSSAGSLHTWDDLGMMTRFQGGTRDELYVYDASNERIAVVRLAPNGSESIREYALRGLDGKVLREVVRDAATPLELHWKRDNIFSGSSLIASIVDDGTGTPKRRHHHADHLGTPRLITNDAGFVLARHTYWPYGEDAPTTEIGSERMKFTAHERDLDTTPGRELDYMHARFYSPSRGRFLSVDPASDVDVLQPQSWNKYVYVRDDPVNSTDPTGMCTDSIVCINYNKVEDAITVTGAPPPQDTWEYIVDGLAAPAQAFNAKVQADWEYVKATEGLEETFPQLAFAFPLALGAVEGGLASATAGVTNPVPASLARVIAGEGPFSTLGRAGANDVFVTAASDIAGMSAQQLGPRLGIPSSGTFTVIQFPTPAVGVASPILRTTPGFVGRGLTSGLAREFVIPNGPVPINSIIRIVQ